MDKAYRIRAAVAGDIETIFSLDRTIENVPHWPLAEYLAALSPADHKPGMPGTSRCLFIVETKSDAAMVGFAVGKATVIEASSLAELESVGVVEPARRSGVGKALCAAVIEWSRGMGATQIELEVRSRSSGPIALYDGLGFAAVGRRAKYYREPVDDAILMRLDLALNPMQVVTHYRDL